ncbi:TRAP transporter small permease [Roseobacter sp.]|uniref:TRAP transporter small permease n=1 Tax=Roseobacter sp. TaxID=1907202 RepID=UPI002966776E|nr:TRAP transporter small permease [Roseobacter sp.]MDW3182765.1 TRAP transporter small permease [Roseobacter sp.]
MSLFVQDGATGKHAYRLRIVIACICAVCLIAMMCLTVADVLGRYIMNAPVPGAAELTELLLAAVVFLGLPAASIDNDHIAVDVLTSRFSETRARLLEIVISFVSASVLTVVGWRIWIVGQQIAGYSGTTPTLKMPLAPVAYGSAILCVIAAMVTLVLAASHWRNRNG